MVVLRTTPAICMQRPPAVGAGIVSCAVQMSHRMIQLSELTIPSRGNGHHPDLSEVVDSP